jgi:hypothetical protein
MRTLRLIFLSAFAGGLAALLVQRMLAPRPSTPASAVAPSPAPTPEAAPVRPSRALDELSPTYRSRRPRLIDYSEEEIGVHLDALARELVQPDMTELEAERAGQVLSDTARKALNYDSRKQDRRRKHDARTDTWLSGINGDVTMDDDADDENMEADDDDARE